MVTLGCWTSVTPATKERLESFLAGGSVTDSIDVELEPAPGATAEIIYPSWASEDVLRRLPPDIVARLRHADATNAGDQT